MILNKVPPSCIEIEESILGDIIYDSSLLDEAIDLKPEYFYKDCTQKIFKAILDLNSKNNPVDLLTTCEQLNKNNELEDVGGRYYVGSLLAKSQISDNILFLSCVIKQKYLQRELIKAGHEIMNKAFDDSVDIDDLVSFSINSIDEPINKILGETSNNDTFAKLLKEAEDKAAEREVLRKKGQVIGIKTPLTILNEYTGGWQGGELIVLAARPSMGKTAMAISIMKECAKNGGVPNLYSLETTKLKIADRILAGEAGVSYDNYKMGYMEPHEWTMISNARYELSKYDIVINDKSTISISYIKSKSRILKKKGRCSMILIDYLQLAKGEGMTKNSNREQEVAAMSRECKNMAKELDVPVIILSQINRSVESRSDKRPMMSDLRESGQIEGDADIVLLLYRPEQYGILEDENGVNTKGRGELIIAKNKEGKTGSVYFGYNESLTKIYDYKDDSKYLSKSDKYYDPNSFIEPNSEFN